MAASVHRGGREYAKGGIRVAPDVILGLSGSAAPTNGVTFAGVAGPGSIYIRTSNGQWYINTNTKASPTWSAVTTS